MFSVLTSIWFLELFGLRFCGLTIDVFVHTCFVRMIVATYETRVLSLFFTTGLWIKYLEILIFQNL